MKEYYLKNKEENKQKQKEYYLKKKLEKEQIIWFILYFIIIIK